MTNQPLKIFIGYDSRQPVSFTVLAHSIISTTSSSVSLTPLCIETLPIKRVGLTPFTFSRFLVPWLCDYKGWALFLDADILLNDDISKLFELADDKYAVMVAKNEKRFEWASVILFNCAKCEMLTPEYIETADNLHLFGWVGENDVGTLPPAWNHLVGYDKPDINARLVHYTQGVPGFFETSVCEHAMKWKTCLKQAISIESWDEIMGPSVHAVTLGNGLRVPKFFVDFDKNKIKPEYEGVFSALVENHANGRR